MLWIYRCIHYGCVIHRHDCCPHVQKCRSKMWTKLIFYYIRKILTNFGAANCRALIGMNAFTGCDTMTAFAGKGKTSSLRLMINNLEVQDTFIQLGQTCDISVELIDKLESVTCLLNAPSATLVNKLRYDLFCAKKWEIESRQLRPCKDSLVKHAQRANYQAAIWKRCLRQNPETPSPVGRGWKMETEQGVEHLSIDWMNGQPAPQAVLDLLTCTFKTRCSLPKCTCLVSGLSIRIYVPIT